MLRNLKLQDGAEPQPKNPINSTPNRTDLDHLELKTPP